MLMSKKIVIKNNKLYRGLLCNLLNANNTFRYDGIIYIDGKYKCNKIKKEIFFRIEINITDIYLDNVFFTIIDSVFYNLGYPYRYNIMRNVVYDIDAKCYIEMNQLKFYGFEYTFRHIINTIQIFDKLIKVGIVVVKSY